MWVVSLVSASFLFAANYCLLEALESHATHPEQSHHETSSSSDSGDERNPCCVALQAIDTPQINSSFIHQTQLPLIPSFFYFFGTDRPIESFRLVKYFYPSITGPPRSAEFYYTSFASHAPPL